MNFKNRKEYNIDAGVTQTGITIDSSTSGWIGTVRFRFDSNATGVVGVRAQIRGEDVQSGVDTLAAKIDAVWMGNLMLETGDTLIIVTEPAVACTVFVTYVYEPWGLGGWQDFAADVLELSSSSSSESSESEGNVSTSSSSDSSASSQSKSSESSSSESAYISRTSSSDSSQIQV